MSNRREIPIGKVKFMNILISSLIFREVVHTPVKGIECHHPLKQFPGRIAVAVASNGGHSGQWIPQHTADVEPTA